MNNINVFKLNEQGSSFRNVRNSCADIEKDSKICGNYNGSTINVQTSTQPTIMSVAMPGKNQDDPSYSYNRENGGNDSNIRVAKPSGINYHKHNNPQNDLNIWRSSIIRAKPITCNIGLTKDG